VFNRSQAEDSYNVCPGSYRPVLHVDGGALSADDLFWGYRASRSIAPSATSATRGRNWRRRSTRESAFTDVFAIHCYPSHRVKG
jgi:hypothetical protein